MRDVIDLKQKCEQQEKMIEILKNAPCTVSSPLQERYAYIQSISDKYSITLLCKTMKTERLCRTDYRSERELRESIREYINYYNNDRPHSVLRYQTPEYFESKYYRSIGVYEETESNANGSNLAK